MIEQPTPQPQQDKPKVFIAILVSAASLIAYAIVLILSAVVIAGILYILSKIPVIGAILNFFFVARGDNPTILTIIVCSILAYEACRFTVERFTVHRPTFALAFLLSGVFLAVLHAICLVANAIGGNAIAANIAQLITGLVMIFKGRDFMALA